MITRPAGTRPNAFSNPMHYTEMHFHHDHDHCHGHSHDHTCTHGHGHAHSHATVQKSDLSQDQTIRLLEYLYHHNEEHAAELAGYQEGVGCSEAHSLLAESVSLLSQSNAKLADAIAVLKVGE